MPQTRLHEDAGPICCSLQVTQLLCNQYSRNGHLTRGCGRLPKSGPCGASRTWIALRASVPNLGMNCAYDVLPSSVETLHVRG